MATNFVQEGDRIDVTAPAGGVTTGLGVLIGGIFGIPVTTAAVGVKFALIVKGVATLVKAAGNAWTEGQAIYWDNTNSNASVSPEAGQFIGHATATATSAATTGDIRLVSTNSGGSGGGSVGVTLTAPTGGVTAGTGVMIVDLWALPLETVAATNDFVAQIEGVITHAKAAVAFAEGERIYWDDSASVITNVATENHFIGLCVEDAISGAANGVVNVQNIIRDQGITVVELTAPTGDTVAGTAYKIGNILGLALEAITATNPFRAQIKGIITHAKAAVTVTEGQRMYWDNVNSVFTNVAAGSYFAGHAMAAAASGAANVVMYLDGIIDDQSKVITSLTAPTGDATLGTAYLIDNILALALETATAASPFEAQVEGIITHAKAAVTVTEGQKMYWDNDNSVFTNLGTGNYYAGYALAAAAGGAANVIMRLKGIDMHNVVSLTSPTGDTVKGTPYLISTALVVANELIVATNACRFRVNGEAIMPILGTDTPSEGDALYWDDGNTRLTTTASTHTLQAYALEAKGSGPATISVWFGGYSGTLTN